MTLPDDTYVQETPQKAPPAHRKFAASASGAVMMPVEDTAAWRALVAHAEKIRPLHLNGLCTASPDRFEDFALSLDDLLVDFSKQRWTRETRGLLTQLADECGLAAKRDAMYAGDLVNSTEGRAALHMALRAPRTGRRFHVDGELITDAVAKTLEHLKSFAGDIRDGTATGHTGSGFRDVVNIGIGGSDLGPRMASEALVYDMDGPTIHYVSNMDGVDICTTLNGLDPATTLFIVASKTFTTQETLTNAETARDWIAASLGEEAIEAHFAAVTAAPDQARAFGLRSDRLFAFWDWVGGRFSIWSAIGLPLLIGLGPEEFEAFLAGAHEVDEHFLEAPWDENIPATLALLSVWNGNFLGIRSHAILPYDQRLVHLPSYLQQLFMESNGKRVGSGGDQINVLTSRVIFGGAGTNGQHAFLQLLHQGTDPVSSDFLVAAQPESQLDGERSLLHHEKLLAHCLAQSAALMTGRSLEQTRQELAGKGLAANIVDALAPHKTCAGNQPSTTFLFKRLRPRTLGKILAIYEHVAFVEAAIWGINPFDQMGVELGKEMATDLLPQVQAAMTKSPVNAADVDPSTAGLLAHIRSLD